MLSINLKNMLFEALRVGVDNDELNSIKLMLLDSKKKFLNEKISFKDLPYDFEKLQKSLKESDEFCKDKDTVVVIGIGGSDLGARAVHRALNHRFYNHFPKKKKIYFTGDTTDPESIKEILDVIDLKKTVFLVISKSGKTIEQSSLFVYLHNEIQKLNLKPQDHFLFITDPIVGTLRELAVKEGYKTIDHPEVGGRYSVLSTVGMVPAFLTGVNVEEILKGAKELDEKFKKDSGELDEILQYAGLIYLYYKGDKKISVIMPYQYKLAEFARWYRQLIAESLGKKVNGKGETVNEGLTPVAAIGPTDQHSQLQLYYEGPNDKIITFIKAEKSRSNLNLPDDYKGIEAYSFLKGRSFQELLGIEQSNTAEYLTKNGRPNSTITIPIVDEYHIGQLFYFFEIVTVLLAYLMDINPFDQPEVEESKNTMYKALGKEI